MYDSFDSCQILCLTLKKHHNVSTLLLQARSAPATLQSSSLKCYDVGDPARAVNPLNLVLFVQFCDNKVPSHLLVKAILCHRL